MSQNPSIRRLMKELRDLEISPDPNIVAGPIHENMFLWHFTIRGPPESPFEGGHYHGKIVFPMEYPLKPPDIYFLTPNGRFEVNAKICLSATSYHPESWQPSWGIRSLLTALIPFLASNMSGIGAIKMSDDERRILARRSQYWRCQECNHQFESESVASEELVTETETNPDLDPVTEEEITSLDKPKMKMFRFIPHVDIPLLAVVCILVVIIVDSVFPFMSRLFKF